MLDCPNAVDELKDFNSHKLFLIKKKNITWCLLRHKNKKTGGNVYDCKLLA